MSKKKKVKKKKQNTKKKQNKTYQLKIKSLPGIIKTKYSSFTITNESYLKDDIDKEVVNFSNVMSDKFYADLEELKKSIKQFNPLTVLSILSYLNLFNEINEDLSQKQKKKLEQFHLEILQALVLQEQAYLKKTVNLEELALIAELLKNIAYSFSFKRMKDLTKSDDMSEKKKIILIEKIRSDTLAIRNWAYPHQVLDITIGLLTNFENRIFLSDSFKYSVLILGIERLIKSIVEKINIFRKKVFNFMTEKNHDNIILKYIENFPELKVKVEELNKMKVLLPDLMRFKLVLFEYAMQILFKNFVFRLDELKKCIEDNIDDILLERFVDKLSYSIGDLNEFNIEHIFLNNPIWERPFIKLSKGYYFYPVPSIFYENVLDWIDYLIRDNEELKIKLEISRSKYLQQKTEEVIKKAFPNAIMYSNINWCDDFEKEYESDLIFLIDHYLFILELKSGKIKPSAKRGALKSVIERADELLVKPSIQSNRLKIYLSQKNDFFEFKQNEEKRVLNISKIKSILRISISLDSFGFLMSKIPELAEAGMISNDVEIAPCLSITDLELIFDMLETECEKIHYLLRRTEVEKNINYIGDEMDLLVFYLENGFNVGDFEFNKNNHINLLERSYELDNYFVNKYFQKNIDIIKPRPARTLWFDSIIRFLEKRKIDGWVELSYYLLNVSHPEQIKFERMVRKIIKNVSIKWKDPNHINHVVLNSSNEKRSNLIIAYAYKDITREDRDENINKIAGKNMEDLNCKECILLGIDVTFGIDKQPYSFIALLKNSQI